MCTLCISSFVRLQYRVYAAIIYDMRYEMSQNILHILFENNFFCLFKRKSPFAEATLEDQSALLFRQDGSLQKVNL